ncbi:GDSL esterase/lipase At4g16230 isoform X1 [Physcomitrium patens]|uniref:GDSL esterase/lipase At4g16230 isoform X1 n=1 Tax=Physcomitrium patens TaxID=3218 RepID=UPI000D15786B|nr:GDSL esterase/lipase At4g16230-like isoform X1 [Physcomitrium patens]XP_024390241.1 GDSL esterase/lipase At4g16230-like isoform X1 [Physcomitrium patens]XP_024390242.1 GDSL esterase/lipase At4g16230-like isoform X1 [Physcomitrium patens]|eukprot:XP_024390240.1 GDSL esterase/lipase At4g16230-like isoform X1 [Physcomitrella patens]
MEYSRRCAVVFTLTVLLIASEAMAQTKRLAPAYFIFGDSLSDPGNNNYLRTLSRADAPPNGIDFPNGKATGRYCNGRTATDILGQSIGIPDFIPPYMAPETKGPAILNGVNYASGAAGILPSSGYLFVSQSISRISLDQQLQDFANTKTQIVAQIGEEATTELLSKSLFYFNLGSNDFLDNYFIPGSPFSRNMTVTQYTDMVLDKYKGQLSQIYSMGGRKVAIASLGPIGCCPFQLTLALRRNGICDEKANEDAIYFNKGILRIVDELNANLPGSDYIYLDVYRAVGEIIASPRDYGFTVKDIGCCGRGPQYRGLVPCLPNMTFCPNRFDYVFWDPYHPTEKTNILISQRFFGSGYTYPKNIPQLLGA